MGDMGTHKSRTFPRSFRAHRTENAKLSEAKTSTLFQTLFILERGIALDTSQVAPNSSAANCHLGRAICSNWEGKMGRTVFAIYQRDR